MNDQSSRLVEYDDLIIGMQNVEGNFLGRGFMHRLGFGIQQQGFSTLQLKGWLGGSAIDCQQALPNPMLKPGTRKVREHRRCHLVETFTGKGLWRDRRVPDALSQALMPVSGSARPTVRNKLIPISCPIRFSTALFEKTFMPVIQHAARRLLHHSVVALVATAMLAGISSCGKDREFPDRRTAGELYADAKESLDKRNWQRAAAEYKLLQTRYPFGRYTEQSMLDLAYAFYKGGQPENALSTLDRFMRTYPAHANIDYAYYLRGLINYQQNLGVLERLIPERVRDRDQTTMRDSFNDFQELLRRFPDSRYAADARQRMVFLRFNLAAYEIAVAEYYMRRKAYIAVVNRARYVLENYPATPQNAEALALLHQAYSALKLTELADDAWSVLELNYPDHYYVLGRKKERSWASRLWPFD